MDDLVRGRALRRAAEILGGDDRLCAFLDVPVHQLEAWQNGAVPPADVLLKTGHILSAAGPVAMSRLVVRRAKNWRSAATLARAHAAAIRQAILARQGRRNADADQPRPARDYLLARFQPGQEREMIETALDAAIGATAAQMGNIQLRELDSLRIIAQRGFHRPFLDFFARVNDAHCACGAAMASGRRTAIADVAADPLFAGTAAGTAMLHAGALAVQSTPLFGADGHLLGMLSTHYHESHQITRREEDVLDRIAKRTALWLDSARS